MAPLRSNDAVPVRTGVALEKLLRDGARPCAYQPHVDLEPYSLRTSLTDAARASRGRPAIHFVNVASRTRYERDFT